MNNLFSLLDSLDPFPKNKRKINKSSTLGDGYFQTFNMGVFHRPFSSYIGPTKYTDMYPEIWDALCELAEEYNFSFTSATINKNLTCPKHRDSKNTGSTLIVSFGDYTGGLLGIETENGDEFIDIHEKPYFFNGKTTTHWTEPFEGTRYSVMLYTTKSAISKTS